MSAGWESMIRVTPCDSWGNAATVGRRGYFLYADSESLSLGAQSKERDGKLVGNRESPPETYTIDRWNPKGGITFQPRVDDVLMLLMAQFQNVVKSGVGTYQFFRNPNQLSWASGGSVFSVGTVIGAAGTLGTGINVYSVNIDKFFSFSFATGTQTNGARFLNGIVEKMTFNQKTSEDLSCTVDFKFLSANYATFPAGYGPLTGLGSFSAFARLVDYMGTFSIANESFEVDSWEGNFMNNSSDKTRLGYRGFSRFPFTGKWIADGSFDMELNRDPQSFSEGSFANLTMTFFSGVGNMLTVAQPNIVYKPFDIPISGGDSIVNVSKPYRAYAPSGTTGPSTILTVYTGTNFGTALLGF